MTPSDLERRVDRSRLFSVVLLLLNLPLGACAKSPISSESCATYAEVLCAKADPESSQCEAIRVATDLMPPAACAEASTDIANATKKLAVAQKSCNEVAQTICAAVGSDSVACKTVRSHYRKLLPEQCAAMSDNIGDVVARVREHYQGSDSSAQALGAQVETTSAHDPRPIE